jgi:hypothetical protein
MIRARRGFVALALLTGLGGCGLHYWGKTDASQDDFNRDSAACAKEASPQYGLFLEDIYRACLKSRGWTRAQQQAPPPAGWYRGIE